MSRCLSRVAFGKASRVKSLEKRMNHLKQLEPPGLRTAARCACAWEGDLFCCWSGPASSKLTWSEPRKYMHVWKEILVLMEEAESHPTGETSLGVEAWGSGRSAT